MVMISEITYFDHHLLFSLLICSIVILEYVRKNNTSTCIKMLTFVIVLFGVLVYILLVTYTS